VWKCVLLVKLGKGVLVTNEPVRFMSVERRAVGKGVHEDEMPWDCNCNTHTHTQNACVPTTCAHSHKRMYS
jgi:hypothetical protein